MDAEPGTSGAAGGGEEVLPPEAKKKKKPEAGQDVIVLDSGSDDEESQYSTTPVKTADLSALGLMDVVEQEVAPKSSRVNLARMQHNRYGRPLSSLVCIVLVSAVWLTEAYLAGFD